MAQYAANASINFERPAPVFVCAVLVAATLTKGGHRSGPSARRSARIRNLERVMIPWDTCSPLMPTWNHLARSA